MPALILCLLWHGPAAAEVDEEASESPDAPAAEAAAAADSGGLPRGMRATGVDAARMAPIGVPTSHALEEGEWGFSYRYEFTHFDDMRDGTRRRQTDDVLVRFDETPRTRDLQVHTFGVSYAPHRRVTLNLQLPVMTQETNLTAQGPPRERFETSSSGVGDLELRVLIPFMRKNNEALQVEFGLTAPTGKKSKRDTGAGGQSSRLSFDQQPGSGTVDILTGAVYRGRWQTLSWGLVGRSTFRFYENSSDYRLGHEYLLSTWLAQSWTDWMSTSLRLSWERREKVNGAARTNVNPERDPKNQAGETIDLGPGVNFRLPWLGEPRLGVEMSWPVFQTLKGPQLERDWQLTTGWEWDF